MTLSAAHSPGKMGLLRDLFNRWSGSSLRSTLFQNSGSFSSKPGGLDKETIKLFLHSPPSQLFLWSGDADLPSLTLKVASLLATSDSVTLTADQIELGFQYRKDQPSRADFWLRKSSHNTWLAGVVFEYGTHGQSLEVHYGLIIKSTCESDVTTLGITDLFGISEC